MQRRLRTSMQTSLGDLAQMMAQLVQPGLRPQEARIAQLWAQIPPSHAWMLERSRKPPMLTPAPAMKPKVQTPAAPPATAPHHLIQRPPDHPHRSYIHPQLQLRLSRQPHPLVPAILCLELLPAQPSLQPKASPALLHWTAQKQGLPHPQQLHLRTAKRASSRAPQRQQSRSRLGPKEPSLPQSPWLWACPGEHPSAGSRWPPPQALQPLPGSCSGNFDFRHPSALAACDDGNKKCIFGGTAHCSASLHSAWMMLRVPSMCQNVIAGGAGKTCAQLPSC